MPNQRAYLGFYPRPARRGDRPIILAAVLLAAIYVASMAVLTFSNQAQQRADALIQRWETNR